MRCLAQRHRPVAIERRLGDPFLICIFTNGSYVAFGLATLMACSEESDTVKGPHVTDLRVVDDDRRFTNGATKIPRRFKDIVSGTIPQLQT